MIQSTKVLDTVQGHKVGRPDQNVFTLPFRSECWSSTRTQTHICFFLTIIQAAGKSTSWRNTHSRLYSQRTCDCEGMQRGKGRWRGRDGVIRRHRWGHSSPASLTETQIKIDAGDLSVLLHFYHSIMIRCISVENALWARFVKYFIKA